MVRTLSRSLFLSYILVLKIDSSEMSGSSPPASGSPLPSGSPPACNSPPVSGSPLTTNDHRPNIKGSITDNESSMGSIAGEVNDSIDDDDDVGKSDEENRLEAKRRMIAKLLKITMDAKRGRLSIESHEELALFLRSKNVIQTESVFEAFALTDRGFYAGNKKRLQQMKTAAGQEALKTSTYWDRPLGIGYGATISAPHMHATALEHLKDHLFPGARVLDVGSGTGFLSACMARMVGNEGRVIGIDHIPELVATSLDNVKDDEAILLRDSNMIRASGEGSCTAREESESRTSCSAETRGPLTLVVGDGRLGYPSAGPYNAIHVGAAAPEIPQELVSQLAPGGRMIIPVGPEATKSSLETDQFLLCVDKKTDGAVEIKKLMGVIYVPLTDKDHQLNP